RDLAHVDLRVDPIADEVVGDRLVDGPNAVEALDDVRQLYDLGPVGVPLPDGFHGVRAGRPGALRRPREVLDAEAGKRPHDRLAALLGVLRGLGQRPVLAGGREAVLLDEALEMPAAGLLA